MIKMGKYEEMLLNNNGKEPYCKKCLESYIPTKDKKYVICGCND